MLSTKRDKSSSLFWLSIVFFMAHLQVQAHAKTPESMYSLSTISDNAMVSIILLNIVLFSYFKKRRVINLGGK